MGRITLTSMLLSFLVSFITILIGWLTWRKEYQQKVKRLREDVSKHLIELRMEAYTDLLSNLKVYSNIRNRSNEDVKDDVIKNRHILHDQLYNKVGLICSHETRQLILYALMGFNEFIDNKITTLELNNRLWALHISLRSDLGIIQPDWEDSVDKINKESKSYLDIHSINKLVNNYPWDKYDYGKQSKID